MEKVHRLESQLFRCLFLLLGIVDGEEIWIGFCEGLDKALFDNRRLLARNGLIRSRKSIPSP